MRAFIRWLGRIVSLVVAVLLLTLAYLHVRGLPPQVTAFLVKQLARAGLATRFDSLRLDLYRGIVATNAVLADARSPDRPLIQIDEVQLQLSLRRLWRRENPITALKIANATISVPTPPDEHGPAAFTAQSAYATFQFDADGAIRVDRLLGVYCGIRLYVSRGRIMPSRAPATAGAKPNFTFLTAIVRELNRIQTASYPQLDVEFDLDLDRPLAGQAAVRLRGSSLEYRHVIIDSARVDVRLVGGVIDIRECTVAVGNGEIRCGGQYDTDAGRFDLRLRSTMDPLVVAAVAPTNVVAALGEIQVHANPTLTVRYVLAPATGSLPQLSGTLETGGLTVRGIEINRIALAFQQQGPVVNLSDVIVETPSGRLTGDGQFHVESSDFEYRLTSTLDPTAWLPLMTPGMRRIVEPAAFPGPPPQIVAEVQGDFVDPDNFAYDATVTARDCRYRGVELTGARGRLTLRQQQLAADDILIERPEGELRGTVHADFRAHRVAFDVATTANPGALAPLLGEKAAQVMQSYRFGPRTTGTATGLVDFDQPGQTAWTAQVENHGFGYWKLTATQARADLIFTNSTLRIDGFQAQFYGGELTGHAEFDFAAPTGPYRIYLKPTEADLKPLLQDIQGKTTDPSGRLSGQVVLAGSGPELVTLTGVGDLQITDATLWQTRLFGVFSRVLDEISPGLGKTKATHAVGTFTIRNHAVRTDDLEIRAGAFTLKSRGKVDFDGKLEFRVQAQLLKAVPLLNIPTAILGKALEYEIGGTVSEPKYRAVFLPKEILPHE